MRLQRSLDAMNKEAAFRIVMTHYPPISADLQTSTVSKMLDEAAVDICVFGHLHSLKRDVELFGKKNKTEYVLVSCDWLEFILVKLC